MREKEDLLKESRAKLSTMDNVKTQIDVLMKVWFVFTPPCTHN
jgi:THO complex subunit 5